MQRTPLAPADGHAIVRHLIGLHLELVEPVVLDGDGVISIRKKMSYVSLNSRSIIAIIIFEKTALESETQCLFVV